jgi:hypothetical protein
VSRGVAAEGGGKHAPPQPPHAKVARPVSQPLWRALPNPAKLRRLAIADVNRGAIPPSLQESLLSVVNAYAENPGSSTELHMRAWLIEHAAALATRGLLVAESAVDGPNLLTDIYGVLIDAEKPDGTLPSSATRGQRVLAALMLADEEIADGGIQQFFANDGAAGVSAARDAARAAGLPEHARLLDDALSGQRGRVDNAWFDLEGVLERRLRAYVHAHPKDFFADAR